jgi:hypothetical protein
MEQVEELLGLINRETIDGVIVASKFVFCQIHPCKDRVHPIYEYKGTRETTQETPKEYLRDELDKRMKGGCTNYHCHHHR